MPDIRKSRPLRRLQVLFNLSTFNLPTSLVRFAAVARIVVCSQGASGRESPDRPAAEKSRREISVSRPDFWYNIGVLRAWATTLERTKQISRAGNGMARSPSAPSSLRTWDASQESLRNYACKDAQKGNCPRTAVSPPSVYLYGLSQAPLAMHRRRFSFPAPTDYKTERKLIGRR